jgi:DNA-directed RNA polymerase subunit RPC12/RpoP
MGSASPRIHVVCPSCGSGFKEHHSKIKSGQTLPCQRCGERIVFDSTSDNPNVRKALRDARQFRMSGGQQTISAKPVLRL